MRVSAMHGSFWLDRCDARTAPRHGTTGARLSFDGFSRWSRCEPRNVVALRYHLVTTRPPPGGGGWLHSEGEWGRAAGQDGQVIGGIECSLRPAILQRSHHPPTTPSTRNTNRRFFLASRPPPRRTAAIPCGGRSSIAFRTRPEWYRRSDHGASAPVRPQDPPSQYSEKERGFAVFLCANV